MNTFSKILEHVVALRMVKAMIGMVVVLSVGEGKMLAVKHCLSPYKGEYRE